jgi:hypothetical protein
MINWIRGLFNKEPEFEVIRNDVPMSTILRWYLYDTGIENPNEIAELVGLTPVSDEGDAKEREDSNKRIEDIMHLMPFIEAVAHISSDVISSIHIKNYIKSNPDEIDSIDEDIESIGLVYKAVAMSNIVGTLAIANHLDLIHLGGVMSELMGIETKENDDEQQ